MVLVKRLVRPLVSVRAFASAPHARKTLRRHAPAVDIVNPVDAIFRELEHIPERVFGRSLSMPRFDDEFFHLESPFVSDRGTLDTKMDFLEKKDSYDVVLDVPGVAKDDVKISVTKDGVLTIKAERKKETSEEKENYHFYERSFGKTERRVQLPEDANLEHIEASHSEGVLSIKIGKKEELAKEKSVREIKIN
jgi:HSP20 family protein